VDDIEEGQVSRMRCVEIVRLGKLTLLEQQKVKMSELSDLLEDIFDFDAGAERLTPDLYLCNRFAAC
jgi:hypothetical protein